MALFAELAYIDDDLEFGDLSQDARAQTELERSHIVNELARDIFGDPAALEASDELYLEAIQHEDPYVIQGLQIFLDEFLSVHQLPGQPTKLTFGVAFEACIPGATALGAFDDVEPIRAWASGHFGIPAEQLYVHPVPTAPGVAFEGLAETMYEVLTAQAADAESIEEVSWSEGRANEAVIGDSQLVMIWVTAHLTHKAEIDALRAKLQEDSTLDNEGEGMRLPFVLAGETCVAKVVPLDYFLPVTSLVQLSFAPALLHIHALVSALVAQPDRTAADILMEVKLVATGDEQSPVHVYVDLVRVSDGLALARVPVAPYIARQAVIDPLLSLAENLGLYNVGFRATPLGPIELWLGDR